MSLKEQVYGVVRQIPEGKVLTYKEVKENYINERGCQLVMLTPV